MFSLCLKFIWIMCWSYQINYQMLNYFLFLFWYMIGSKLNLISMPKCVTCIFLYAKCAPHHRFWYQQKKNHFFITSEETFLIQNLIRKWVSQVQSLAGLIRISEILNLQNKIYIFFPEITTYSSTHSTDIVRF